MVNSTEGRVYFQNGFVKNAPVYGLTADISDKSAGQEDKVNRMG